MRKVGKKRGGGDVGKCANEGRGACSAAYSDVRGLNQVPDSNVSNAKRRGMDLNALALNHEMKDFLKIGIVNVQAIAVSARDGRACLGVILIRKLLRVNAPAPMGLSNESPLAENSVQRRNCKPRMCFASTINGGASDFQ